MTALPIVNATGVQVGDTLSEDGTVAYPPIPEFLPERFATIRNLDASRHKQFHAGMRQLSEEGVVRVLRRTNGLGEPTVGVVGELQLEVAVERLSNEFGCRVERHATAWEACRGLDTADVARVPPWRNLEVVTDGSGRTLVLAASSFMFERLDREVTDLRWQAGD